MTRSRVCERLLGAYLLIILHVQGKYLLVITVTETCIPVVGVEVFPFGVGKFFCSFAGKWLCLPDMPYRQFTKEKDIIVVMCWPEMQSTVWSKSLKV